ncbi:hypothetical protein CVT25_002688 [Psilocybe cyanescens]|uniref:Uncharacterized protein n=1 Tax=Psilocybe cyanescens TaxID=93625 RepID=A0A409WLQ6_PSICY|nr:hypothetical protein CVT25_002688 [Psilocybe cyanescens]
MAQTIAVSHPPAMKVGGRRLSISAKPKGHPHAETANTGSLGVDDVAADYPRPAPPNGEAPLHRNYQHNEEEVPKKEKIEKKLQELAHRKVEMTRPTREANTGSKGHAAGMRIAQPAGKSLGV